MSPNADSLASTVPALRLRAHGKVSPRGAAALVLYWMTAQRRTGWNYALQRAAEWAAALARPLVVVEPLACGQRWDNDRHHRFVAAGMAANARALAGRPVTYISFIEPAAGAAQQLLRQLAERAAMVVTDDFPLRSSADVPDDLPAPVEHIDSCGLLPLRAVEQTYPSAFAFRRFLQRAMPQHLADLPAADPLADAALPAPLPLADVLRDAAAAGVDLDDARLARLPIDHGVAPVAAAVGGSAAAQERLARFVAERLPRYHLERNEPEKEVTSGLAPYLHHGHIAAAEVFHAIARAENWSPTRLGEAVTGQRAAWWGMGPAAEAFLDELITWREVGYAYCALRPDDYAAYESLPDWALATLAKHTGDRRTYAYSRDEFAAARTHDPLWNAAQRQLLREGTIHNYLRMLWGKKVLEWSTSPPEALATLIELNNRFALDGRDPNSYSGIGWIFGRFDRPWGPERPIFGTVRYMSSENTAKKMRVRDYIARYGE